MSQGMLLSAEEWTTAVTRAEAAAAGDAAGAGEPDPLVAAIAQHLLAPVRIQLIATAGERGTATRVTIVDDRVLLVTQPLAEVDGQIAVGGEAQLAFARPEGIWPAIAETLPPLQAFQLGRPEPGAADREIPASEANGLLAREQANLQVRVEAWQEVTVPARVWARLWSVVDGRLLDVRTRQGELRVTERPAGSVAAELEWALVGALDVVAQTGAE